MKKTFAFFMAAIMFLSFGISCFANSQAKTEADTKITAEFGVDSKSAILMEATTGTVLFERNADEALSPASVTKIMTLLLVMEAVEDEQIKLDDKVNISAYAASMGGSQVFLEEGEYISVEELIKCTVIASANDAAVALAEHVAGTEASFVALMNLRAKQLGMKSTSFENVTGLDDTVEYHKMSARDIAEASRALLKFPLIVKYASLWQDTIRDGEFTLTNTNRLVRYYDGCNGLKTGSTDKAGYCVSACAKRNGMQLIAVVMGAETRDERNALARSMLDYGFANYAMFEAREEALENARVLGGKTSYTTLYRKSFSCVVEKSELKKIETVYQIPESITAPRSNGESVGKVVYKLGEKVLGESSIVVTEDIPKIKFTDIVAMMIKKIFSL